MIIIPNFIFSGERDFCVVKNKINNKFKKKKEKEKEKEGHAWEKKGSEWEMQSGKDVIESMKESAANAAASARSAVQKNQGHPAREGFSFSFFFFH